MAVVRDAAGSLEVFVVAANGTVSTSTQVSATRWAPWSQIGLDSATTVSAVLRSDRSIQVFALDQSGSLVTTTRRGKTWISWAPLGYGQVAAIAITFGTGGSVLVFGGSNPHTFAVRSGDDLELGGPSRGLILTSDTSAQAWTQLPSLPRPANLGFARVGL